MKSYQNQYEHGKIFFPWWNIIWHFAKSFPWCGTILGDSTKIFKWNQIWIPKSPPNHDITYKNIISNNKILREFDEIYIRKSFKIIKNSKDIYICSFHAITTMQQSPGIKHRPTPINSIITPCHPRETKTNIIKRLALQWIYL